ncbi:MAG: hypothetical protein KJ674_05440 [Nanoarchaeota archaeon]|nr:hypothetical protein [Nanoarchaeota archaeon]
MKRRKLRTNRVIVLILLFFIVGIIAGGLIGYKEDKEKISEGITLLDRSIIDADARFSYIKIPAVDQDGNGVSTDLLVEVLPGNGRTLVDIDNLLFWADTQNSIRMAKEVASNYTGMDLGGYDVIYHIQANASLIGGPSAGSAITIATVAALESKKLREDVMITGSVNHDGSLGPVGEITGKARVAKEKNATIFLVPLLQSREVTYEERQYCRNFGFTEFCTMEQIPVNINVGEAAGIEVIEVGNIEEALEYFYE